jgi:thioredoxin-related protein
MRLQAFIPIFLVAVLIMETGTVAALGGDKNELRWSALDQGLIEANRTGKKILIDVYTTWCGWCKKMDTDTYSNARVSSYLQSHYVLVKLNAESSKQLTYKGEKYSEQDFARAFGVDGYPTILFLKSNGEPITKYSGYANAATFHDVVSYIAEDHYLTKKYDEYLKEKKK